LSEFGAEVSSRIKNFNAQAQIAQPKFLIRKTSANIAQVNNKIGKTQAQIAQEKIKSVKRKRKLRNFFQKFNKAQIE